MYERLLRDLTPVPDQPLECSVNLWSSESTELAGPLNRQTDLEQVAVMRRLTGRRGHEGEVPFAVRRRAASAAAAVIAAAPAPRATP